MIIAGQSMQVTDSWIEDSYFQIVNPDGACFHVLSKSEVESFSEDSYICTNTSVYKTIVWGEFEFKVLYQNGARGNYKGHDSGKGSNLDLFSDYSEGLPTNKFYLICKEWEWLYYNERKGRNCTHSANGMLTALGIDYLMTEEDVVNFYALLHAHTPTNSLLGLEDDKHKLIFSVEVDDEDNQYTDSVELVEKRWGELRYGDWVHNMYSKEKNNQI